MEKPAKNKTAKGLVSLITIIIVLSSILAGSIYYEKSASTITGRVTGMEGVSGMQGAEQAQTPKVNYPHLGDILPFIELSDGKRANLDGEYFIPASDIGIPIYKDDEGKRYKSRGEPVGNSQYGYDYVAKREIKGQVNVDYLYSASGNSIFTDNPIGVRISGEGRRDYEISKDGYEQKIKPHLEKAGYSASYEYLVDTKSGDRVGIKIFNKDSEITKLYFSGPEGATIPEFYFSSSEGREFLESKGLISRQTTDTTSSTAQTKQPPTSNIYISPNSVRVDDIIAGKKVIKVERNEKDKITTIALEGDKKITIGDNQVVDKRTGTVKSKPSVGAIGAQAVGTVGSSGPRPDQEKPIFDEPNNDGLAVFIYAPDKNGMQRIEIEYQDPISVHKDILGTITENNWDRTLTRIENEVQFTIKDKNIIRDIRIYPDTGRQLVNEQTLDSSGKATSLVVTEKIGNGKGGFTGDTKIIRRPNFNAENEVYTEELRFASDDIKSIKYKVSQVGNTIKHNIDTVTFKSASGKTLVISGEAYSSLRVADNNLASFSEHARKIGINNINKVNQKDGVNHVGNLDGNHIRLLINNNFAAMKGANLVGYVNNDGTSISIDGKANLKEDGGYELHVSSTAFVRSKGADGNYYISRIEHRTSKGDLISGDYNLQVGTTEIEARDFDLTKRPYSNPYSEPKKYILYPPESNPSSKVYGMQKVEVDSETYYIDTSESGFGTFLGIGSVDIYNAEGKKVDKNLDDVKLIINEGLKKEGLPTLRQQSSQQFFRNLELTFTEFRGLRYWAKFFMNEDKLLEWREKTDEIFAKYYLGTEYWTSKICDKYIDGEQVGIAFAETPQGLAQIGAHVEAARTKPITTENGTTYIYKITFNVRNGDYEKDLRAPEEMKINVVLKGERTIDVFKQEQTIKRGSSFGKSGRNAIVKESIALYSQICIRFDKTPLRWKLDDKELCNKIQESSEEPTKIETPETKAQKKAAEAELNDF